MKWSTCSWHGSNVKRQWCHPSSCHCKHSLLFTSYNRQFVSPPLSLSHLPFSHSLYFPSSLCPLCFPVHQAAEGGVSEEDAGFRARCCRRMALRIQGKGIPLLSAPPSWLMFMKCSPGGHLGRISSWKKPHTVGVTLVMKESVERASYRMSVLQHFIPF